MRFWNNLSKNSSVKNSAKQTLKEELEKYREYKQSYQQFLGNLFRKEDRELKRFFRDHQKEDTLIRVSNFLFTLEQLFAPYPDYKFTLPELFHHPKHRPKMLEEFAFQDCLEAIHVTLQEFRKGFPKIPLGLRILNGDPEGFLFTGDLMEFLYGQKVLQMISS